MAGWSVSARQATRTQLGGFSSSLIHLRGFAADHGPPIPKVKFWEDPLHPSRWKEEHFAIVSLAGWGALFYGGYKFFTRGKNEKKDRKVGESSE